MRHSAAAIAISAIITVGGPAHSQPTTIQPFGLKFGSPLATAKPGPKVDDGTWLAKPPLPSSLFERYHVKATPQTGICKVTGFAHQQSGPFNMDGTYATYDAAIATLKKKYGAPSAELDPRKPGEGQSKLTGSPFDEPRGPLAIWFVNGGYSGSISLSVTGPTSVVVSYTSDNTKRCLETIEASAKAKASQGL